MPASQLTLPFNSNPSNSAAAFVLNYKNGCSDLIKATGAITQTADTGQISWVAGSYTTTANTSAGYEIFGFNDSLQATYPVYFKIEYGFGSSTSWPQVWITVGSGTNGAGTITGVVSQRVAALPSVAWGAITNARTSYATGSATDSAVCWVGWPGGEDASPATAGGGFFLIERCRDWDGTPNGYGVMLVCHAISFSDPNAKSWFMKFQDTAMGPAQQYIGGLATTICSSIISGVTLPSSGIVGSDQYFFPVLTGFYVFVVGAPSKYVVGILGNDNPLCTKTPIPIYGSTQSVINMRGTQNDLKGTITNMGVAVRYT